MPKAGLCNYDMKAAMHVVLVNSSVALNVLNGILQCYIWLFSSC